MKQHVQSINSRPMTRVEFNTFTIRTLVGWYERGLLNLEPEFQRKSVWKKQQRAKAGMKPPVYKDQRKGDFRSRQDVDARRAGAPGRIAR